MRIIFALLAAGLLSFVGCRGGENSQTGILALSPPQAELELLAPGQISTHFREHCVPVVSPDGQSLFFSRKERDFPDIFTCRWTDEGWSDPLPVSFNSDALDDGPAFSPDGKRLYFGSRRSRKPGGVARQDTDLWYVDRQGEGWGEPVLMEALTTDQSESFPTLTDAGVLYFHSSREGGLGTDLYRADPVAGGFSAPSDCPTTSTPPARMPLLSSPVTALIFFSSVSTHPTFPPCGSCTPRH